MTRSCYVIAEAGSCHDGSLEKAIQLIDTAHTAGANAVKFQWWSDSKALAIRRHDESLQSKYEPYRMPEWWLPSLHAECEAVGIDFMCTVYMVQDIPVIAPFVKQFKVASFDAKDQNFRKALWEFGKPVILSLGMLEAREIPMTESKVLHCVSSYPCPLEQVNLGASATLCIV